MSVPKPGTGLRLLSFDGGGIRAVSQALMVREMAYRIEYDCQLSSPARICDYFDMICGSGFGGLLAIMCGILKMTGDQLVEEFVALCKAVFSQSFDVLQRTTVLENEVKRLIRNYSTGGEEAKMLNEDDTCKTFVCAVASQNTTHARLFRNYGSRANRSPDCAIWEAALATMAAPSLFAPIVIGKQPLVEMFVGGELGWSNPTDELTQEAARVFKDRHVSCVINIGSGHPGHLSLSQGLSELFSSMASDCERIVEDMERRFEKTPGAFWRLGVEQGLQHLAIDLSNLDSLVSHTHSYLQNTRTTRNIDILLQDIVRRPERISVEGISGKATGAPVVRRKLCPQPSQYFTGRRAMVQKLEAHFFSDGESSCHIGVLYGIGGSGKTQIGLQFIQENKIQFSDVFFIDGSDKFNLENDFKSITTEVSNQPTLDDAFLILRTSKTNWLLFIDNADDPTLDLRPYIKWPHGNILITTRNRELRVHAPKCSIQVDRLELEDAKELLLGGVIVSENPETNEAASKIVQQLGCLALAVNHARAFLAQDICTLSEYLPMYMQNRRRLLETKFVQSTDDYEHTVYTTWLISFEKLSSAAALLFELLCFMHHEAIPSRIFEDAWKSLEDAEDDAVPTTLLSFLSCLEATDSAWDTFRFRMLIKEILSFSLIEFNIVNHTFSFHPLVQQWAQ
ncbi:acyl transferase/acyl hydrolase/lysophospholipase, partial [Flagelloscypha sp. PMI_526]